MATRGREGGRESGLDLKWGNDEGRGDCLGRGNFTGCGEQTVELVRMIVSFDDRDDVSIEWSSLRMFLILRSVSRHIK